MIIFLHHLYYNTEKYRKKIKLHFQKSNIKQLLKMQFIILIINKISVFIFIND